MLRFKQINSVSLGHIEVLDGGSQYDDTDGPTLFAITPPTANT